MNSFRFQLTAWYVAFFAALFLLFSFFLYSVLGRALQARLDDTLRSQAATGLSLLQDEMEEEHGESQIAARNAVSNMRPGASTVAIYQGKRLLAATGPAPQLAGLAAGAPSGRLVTLAGERVAVNRWKDFEIVASQPLDSIAVNLAVVREVMVFAFPLFLSLAGIGGWLLATRSLRPLRSIAGQTRSITSQNLHSRIELGRAADEFSILAGSFNDLLARLDRSFESMRRFVADASHELRTPISVIRGEADVALSRNRSAAEYRESLAVILDESKRLSRLIDDLLNLARADAGHVRLQMGELYLDELLAECCRSMEGLAAARDIAIEHRCPAEVPIHGDEQLLRRLVINLLDNAIRYTPPGGRIAAELERAAGAAAPSVRIRISDTGPGVPAAAAAHIFERFYRADEARSRDSSQQAGGFGLGLSIVKWIAESHHGSVELASTSEAGSTFTVTLPVG